MNENRVIKTCKGVTRFTLQSPGLSGHGRIYASIGHRQRFKGKYRRVLACPAGTRYDLERIFIGYWMREGVTPVLADVKDEKVSA